MLPLKPDPAAVLNQAVRSLTRAAITSGLAALDRGIRQDEFIEKTSPEDDGVALVLRAATHPTTRGEAPALSAISTAFLSALVPMSAGADLFSRSLSLSFGPGVATISVPRLAIPSADFVREGTAIPVVQGSPVTAATLHPCKIKSMIMVTWGLLSNPSAEELLRAMLVESTGPALDTALFSAAAAVTSERPTGLLNGIVATPSTGDIVDDVVRLATVIAPVSGNGQIAIVASPAVAVSLDLKLPRQVAFPILASSSLADGTVIAIALNALVSAIEGAPRIEASTQAAVHAETVPATDIGGGAVAPIRSLHQTDTAALRMTWGLTWALRDPRAIAWTQER